MKLDKLSFADIFNYFFTGFWIFFVANILKCDFAKFICTNETIKYTVPIIFLGAVSYFIFRTFIYIWLAPLAGCLTRRTNVRKFFMETCNIKGPEANDLFNNLEKDNEKLNIDKSKIWISSHNLLYTIGLIGIMGAIFGLIKTLNNCNNYEFYSLISLLVFSLICFIVALVSDSFRQKRLFRNLLINLDEDMLNKIMLFQNINNLSNIDKLAKIKENVESN